MHRPPLLPVWRRLAAVTHRLLRHAWRSSVWAAAASLRTSSGDRLTTQTILLKPVQEFPFTPSKSLTSGGLYDIFIQNVQFNVVNNWKSGFRWLDSKTRTKPPCGTCWTTFWNRGSVSSSKMSSFREGNAQITASQQTTHKLKRFTVLIDPGHKTKDYKVINMLR